MLLYWLFDAYRSGTSKNCQNCVATPFDVLGTVRSHDASWNIVHNDCFHQCIACDALQVLWRSFLSLPPSLAMSHVTSPTLALVICLLAPCICFCSVLLLAVSLRPGDGLPSPPHNTVGCAKRHENHIPPTRCLKTKINTNANFHAPNHAVQHGAGFTNLDIPSKMHYHILHGVPQTQWLCQVVGPLC